MDLQSSESTTCRTSAVRVTSKRDVPSTQTKMPDVLGTQNMLETMPALKVMHQSIEQHKGERQHSLLLR